jgi:hypothetical protein
MQWQVPQQHITDVRGLERLSIVEAYVRSELYLPGQTVVGTLPFFREALLRSASGRVRDQGFERNEANSRLNPGTAALARRGTEANRQGDV